MLLRRFAALLVALAALAACSGGGGSLEGGPNASAEGGSNSPAASPAGGACPRTGDDTLDVATYIEPRGLDPLAVSGGSYGGMEVAAIYDTLMRWDPETRQYEPWLAKGLEPNDAFTQWTLTLRDGVTFSNGDVLDARAVAASIRRHRDPANNSNLASLVAPVTEIEVVDPTTVVFRLDRPWPGFPFALANSPGMITNPAIAAERGEGLAKNAAGAGAGPYVVERYAPGEELVLTAREGYWGGEVCIPKLRFVRLSGSKATYDAFLQGGLDVAFLRDPKVIAEARDNGEHMRAWVMNLGEILLINHGVQDSTPVTADVRIRRAVAMAINAEQVDQRVNDGTGLASKALIAPGIPIAPDVPALPYDPERAKSLVADAKADGWDGTIRVMCDNAPSRKQTGLAVAAQLEAAGFDVDLDVSQTIGAVVGQVFKANFDLACWGINVHAAGVWAKMAKQLAGDSPSNFAGFHNDEWDATIAELRGAATVQQTRELLAELQRIANEAVPVIPLAAVEEVIIWQEDVAGIAPSAESLLLFGNVRFAE